MKIVIFGLSISSSWGNGHATLWRALWRALVRRGHRLVFFEKDVPYYAAHRDLTNLPGGEIILYAHWDAVCVRAQRECSSADVALVTSYCPDAIAACELALESPAEVKSFYDLDTPVTLNGLRAGKNVFYIPPNGLSGFDVVLSYTGGDALDALKNELGARRAMPLYGSVDPDVHYPVPAVPGYRADFSYLGTYAEDRQEMLERLFMQPARQLPEKRFLIGGAQYPDSFPWCRNIFFVQHLPPGEHPAFFSSSRATLNVTRRAMANMGYCPSGRLFEAAACGVPIISDSWAGFSEFFEPGREVAIAETSAEVLTALNDADDLAAMGQRARERTLDEHTSARRAIEFERIMESLASGKSDNEVRLVQPVASMA